MEKSQGRVRNYVVSQKYSFCSILAKTLCQLQIPYVQIENEFHFDDKIYRFYSLDECLELVGQVKFVGFDSEKVITLEPQNLLFTRDKCDLEQIFISTDDSEFLDDSSYFEEEKKQDNCYTKKKRIHDNAMVNRRLRQNADLKKDFINRRRNNL